MRVQRKRRGGGGSFFALTFLALVLADAFWFWTHRPAPGPTPTPRPTVTVGRFPPDPSKAVNDLVVALHAGLESRDLLKLLDRPVETRLVDAGGVNAHVYREVYRLPRRWTPEAITGLLAPQAKKAGARLVEGVWRPGREGRVFEAVYGFSGGWAPVTLGFLEVAAPRLALVIDDAGYKEGRDLGVLWGLKIPATLAAIPGLPYATDIARRAPEFGWEVICHLPMEGGEKIPPGAYRWFLRPHTPPEDVERLLSEALDVLPHCRGMNNHMGSRATEERDLMLQVAHFLRGRGMYFLDSRTSDKTVALEMMRRAGVPATERHVFLDNEEDETYIRRQLDLAVAKARKKGFAVAIGHFRPHTLRVLAKSLPSVRESGVKLVYLSELVE